MTYEMTAPRAGHEYPRDVEPGAILVAVKPDDPDNRALPAAQWLAEHAHRELHVVSVIDTAPLISPFAAGTPALPPFHDVSERDEVKRRLQEVVERPEHRPSTHRVSTLEGNPAVTITDLAREHDATVIVIGTGTHGKLSHLIHGEQALEILRRSRSPVLVVPPAATFPIVRAMVAVDFSAASKVAAATALAMLAAGGCLTLVNVRNARQGSTRGAGWPSVAGGKRRRETLSQFARGLPEKPGVVVETTVLHGSPTELLLTYAYAHEMQMLAFGWHDHAPLERIFVHSNAVELLHRAVCMVLVAPAPRTIHGTGDAA
jgi:nucleotide-binding universal stress UspA family protein